jgi:hypothetical protein
MSADQNELTNQESKIDFDIQECVSDEECANQEKSLPENAAMIDMNCSQNEVSHL